MTAVRDNPRLAARPSLPPVSTGSLPLPFWPWPDPPPAMTAGGAVVALRSSGGPRAVGRAAPVEGGGTAGVGYALGAGGLDEPSVWTTLRLKLRGSSGVFQTTS